MQAGNRKSPVGGQDTRHGSLEENIATARALKPLAGSQTLVPDPDCNWPIRAALLRLIPVLCFRQPHPRHAYYREISWAFNLIFLPLIPSVMVVSTHLVLLTVHASLEGNGLAWMLEECWNEVISFGFILQGSWGVKATRNNGLDSSLSYFWRGLFMLESEFYTPRSSPPPLGHLDPSHRFRSPSNHGLSKPGHIS
ncbi:hypothetical protein ASPTUDRAFT_52114 [Aspergillus tubingensis CBS 134.48]|uniref:Uncharacterized protein n=1 Tax=Aspergillus tubingensis (strain CBS 134.48) TaxID=767770 RepID=A0A1L9NLQ4_ASPTC|nr:hypothetical protein ASPTUDRAFT_52114 [Aspergillus tubingensis CBS 134.48]